MPAERDPRSDAACSPMRLIGAILAQGVIRLLERQARQDHLDSLTEQRVSTGVLTTKGNTSD